MEGHEDLVDIPLQLRNPVEGSPLAESAQVERGQLLSDPDQMQGKADAVIQEGQDDANGQYSFLKFHMVEDENATDESNNKSGDEGAGPNTAGAMRRTIEDSYASKVGSGFGRRKSSQNSHYSKGSGQNSKKGSVKNASMVNNFFQAHQVHNPVVSSVMK